MKMAHIINPVKAKEDSDLFIAQPVTFASLQKALTEKPQDTDVGIYAVNFPEDDAVIPDFVQKLPHLTRSVLDYGNFQRNKKYPLLHDILESVYRHSDAEYLIFTNMDISLMPQFYTVVVHFLKKGHDALLINRRGLDRIYTNAGELPLMYSDFGKPHPGFDCFVMHRNLFPKLILGKIGAGVSFSEVALVHNLIAFAQNLKLIDDLHLTFHIGAEVMPPLDPQYYGYNRSEYEQHIYPAIRPQLHISKFPYAALPVQKRLLKWMLNPVFRSHQVAEMEGRGLLRRIKYRLDGWRFALLDKIR